MVYHYLQCDAPKISKLVYNSNVSMVYGTYNELVTGAFVNQRSHHNGGPHIVRIMLIDFPRKSRGSMRIHSRKLRQ